MFKRGSEPGRIIKIDRCVGVEIEAEKTRRYDYYDWDRLHEIDVVVATDCSLRNGNEFKLPPRSLNLFEDTTTDTCNVLDTYGYVASKRCGLHVHIDARDIIDDAKALSRLLRVFYANDDILFSTQPHTRWLNDYVMRLTTMYTTDIFDSDKILDIHSKEYQANTPTALSAIKSSRFMQHYSAVNFGNLGRWDGSEGKGSIEFRHHSGTVKAEKIINWANVLLIMFDYALNGYNYKEIRALFEMKTSDKKLDRFIKTFGFNGQEEAYIRDRISKFNPGLMVSFHHTNRYTFNKVYKDVVKNSPEFKLEQATREQSEAYARYSQSRRTTYDAWGYPIYTYDEELTRKYHEARRERDRLYNEYYDISPKRDIPSRYLKTKELEAVIPLVKKNMMPKHEEASEAK